MISSRGLATTTFRIAAPRCHGARFHNSRVGTSAYIASNWYRSFTNALLRGVHYTWFAQLATIGELGIGIALLVGAFTAIAACVGGVLN